MNFPETTTKEEKEYIKKRYIENGKKLLNTYECKVKDFEDTIKLYRRFKRMNKDRIKELKRGIKEAEKTVVE